MLPGGRCSPKDLAQPSRSSSRPQHPPTQLGLPSEMSKQQDFLVTAVTPTRPGKRGGGGGVRALPARALSCPTHSSAQPNPPCTHRSVTVTRTDPEPSNRATAASPHCPPPRPPQCATRSQHSPAHPLSSSAPQTHPEQQTPLPAPHTSSLLGCEVPRSPHGDPHTGLPARPSPPALCCAEPCRWQSQADTNIIPSCGPG